MDANTIAMVAKKVYREALMARLAEYGGDAKKAFTGKNSLEKNPIWLNAEHSEAVPLKVKVVEFGHYYPIRKPVSPDLKIEKVIDRGVRRVLEARLKEYGGDAKKAFSNLDENPIWLNKEKGIAVKSVRIQGVLSVIPLHETKDSHGKKRPIDFVQTSGTHHVAIYRDSNGKLQDESVSFFKATVRKAQEIPIINKELNKEEGWEFLFSMKQNEYFIFPENDFSPEDLDLFDTANYDLISKHLYRVQKLSKVDYGNTCVREYVFRHHLETTINDCKPLKDITYKSIKSLPPLEGVIKVRVNHIGQIVAIGEY